MRKILKETINFRKAISVILVLECMAVAFACSSQASSATNKELLITGKTAQYFTEDAIPDTDITNILNAGINATSASLRKPFDEVTSIIK
ncbi:MAG: hypothetical protein IKI71_05160 [Lachnospiraceae bacterium]|nr:hypothetical protein [Lachnospiraceae bacterium]